MSDDRHIEEIGVRQALIQKSLLAISLQSDMLVSMCVCPELLELVI